MRWFGKKALAVGIRDTALLYPVLLLLALYIFDSSPYLLATLFGLSLGFGGVIGYRLRTEVAYAASVVFPILSTVLIMVTGSIGLRGIFLLMLLGLAGLRGVQQAGRASRPSKYTLIVFGWLTVAIFVYIWAMRGGVLAPYSFSIYAACTITLLSLLLRWNDQRVRVATGLYGDEDTPESRLKRMNRTFMVGFLLILVLIGGATQLSVVLEWLVQFWRYLWSGSIYEAPLNSSTPSRSNLPEPEEAPLYEDLEEEGEEIGWMRWIAWIVAGIVFASIGAAVFYLLRMLYGVLSQWLPDWLNRLLASLRIAVRPMQEPEHISYQDTTEKMKPRKRTVKKGSPRIIEPPAGARRDYFRLVQAAIRRGYTFYPWKTPTETGRDLVAFTDSTEQQDPAQVEEIVGRYNQSRYQQNE